MNSKHSSLRVSVRKPRPAQKPAAVFEALDSRVLLSASVARAAVAAANMVTNSVKAEVAEQWIAKQYTPTAHTALATTGYLTKPAGAKANLRTIATNFLKSQLSGAGIASTVADSALVTASYTDRNPDGSAGMTHTYFQEMYNGLPVLNAVANVSVDALGRVIAASNNFVALPAANAISTPKLGIVQALGGVASSLGLSVARGVKVVTAATTGNLATKLTAPDLSSKPIDATLAYVAGKDGSLGLVWHASMDLPDQSHWYDLGISTDTGAVTFATDYVDSFVDGSIYNVYALPTISPIDGPRTLLIDPSDPVASPFGWHDTNGVLGADTNQSVGNNVSAQEDRDANNTGGTRATSAALNFDFAVDPTLEPTTTNNQLAAITNLFYLNNKIHDVAYRYGFTEAAGSFQTNNYGKGGLGNDAVQADAQDGNGTNNANFATPPDGQAGRMQMYLFTAPTPDRDGDLDATIVIHEYTHGISTRLTGGPANSSSLDALQSGGMGEGWGDWLALLLTMKSSDTSTTRRPSGTYALNQNNTTGAGIRRYPYTTDKAVNPLVSSSFNASTEVHDAGEIWCTVLWDMTWALINKYGKSSSLGKSLYDGYTPGGTNGGDALAMRLVFDGMKLQPANPSFKQARDAILAADLALTGGANQREIWTAFAGRGFGADFADASANAQTVSAGYLVYTPDPAILDAATIDVAQPLSSLTFKFNEAVNPTTFSVADDVLSFTGPGGADLKPKITGFTFSDAQTLQISFAKQTAIGAYTISFGPDILAGDNGHQMDQNRNWTAGEAGDVFTQTVNFQPFTTGDGFGYKVGPAAMDPSLDLTAGAPGVITLLNGSDDSSAAINLGTNKFTFYGTQYTGAASIYASTNGLITFGTASSAFINTNLTTSPTQAAIAVLWNDWQTNTSGTLDAVLTRLDDTTGDGIPDRLIVEWNDVRDVDSTSDGVTFRAILQLNTGTTAGAIVLSYPDLQSSAATSSFGAGSTVGIKASGTQTTAASANRQLLSFDQANFRYIGNGKAVRVALDVDSPRVAQGAYNFDTDRAVRLGFSENVLASLDVADFSLVNLTTGTTVPAANYTLVQDAATNAVSLVPNASINNGTFADGNYRLTVNANGVKDASGLNLDGDSDYIDGGDYSLDFFVLAGDANRDHKVGFEDLVLVAQNYNKPGTFSQGDFDYDGTVEFDDLVILAQRYTGGSALADFAAITSQPPATPTKPGPKLKRPPNDVIA